jgi:hypothetical protein
MTNNSQTMYCDTNDGKLKKLIKNEPENSELDVDDILNNLNISSTSSSTDAIAEIITEEQIYYLIIIIISLLLLFGFGIIFINLFQDDVSLQQPYYQQSF